MIKNRLNVYRHLNRYLYRQKQIKKIRSTDPKDDISVAYHGLERNGTNYLASCLSQTSFTILNDHISNRRRYGHKHYRWYQNRLAIPSFYRKYYFHRNDIQSLSQLNRLCGFPNNTIHLVIKKDPTAACVSFMNFAIRSLYYRNKKNALSQQSAILSDYHEYYSFWTNLSLKYPKNVRIISYENFQTEFLNFVHDAIGSTAQMYETKIRTNVTKVNMSPPNRVSYVFPEDLV